MPSSSDYPLAFLIFLFSFSFSFFFFFFFALFNSHLRGTSVSSQSLDTYFAGSCVVRDITAQDKRIHTKKNTGFFETFIGCIGRTIYP